MTGRPVLLAAGGRHRTAHRLLGGWPAGAPVHVLAGPSAPVHVFAGPSAPVLALLAVIALLGAAALLLAWASSRRRGVRSRAARFAKRRALAELHVPGAQAGRLILGVHHGSTVAAQARASVMVLGPSQSGKTTGLVVPALLEWAGPALCTSVKSDVVHDTFAARTGRGDVHVFDPTGATQLPHTPWSPLAAAQSWEGARRTAARLLGVGEQGAARSADESFWRPAGARYLAPLLLAAAHGELSMREVLSWVATVEEQEPSELLGDCPDPGAQPALEALQSVWEADARFRSSLLQTVATALDPWQEPAITAATIGESRIGAEWLLDGQNTLYLISPADEQRRLRGLFTALVADIVAGAFHRCAQSGAAIDPPLLLALDEAANIAPLPNLDEIASTGPGQGVQLLTVLQNVSQATDRWGRDRAETIIANHRARMFCSGIGDRATLDYLRHTLGEEEIKRRSTSRPGALRAGSKTISSDFRPLAAAHRIRQMRTDEALLVYGRLEPAWLELRPWYSHPALRAIAAGSRAPDAPLAPPREPAGPALRRARRLLTHAAPAPRVGRLSCPIFAAVRRRWGRRQPPHPRNQQKEGSK
ncbi:MAG TPA: type IV secretory system conjugative DNA transfer family protein [Solirubrobacteraceae bacterium]|jgi:type IV secretion system protein VirD4